jgi:CubicO group peptidase (beta-lactamase class C family)
MKIAMLIFAGLLGIAITGVLYLRHRMSAAPDKLNLEAAIDAEVGKIRKGGLFPGLVVGVYRDGRTFIKGYGTVNKELSRCPDSTTLFQIGSVSKLLTASLLQALNDEKVVSMDATLGELLGASMPLSGSVQSVTLRQLVTHTSGFPSIPKAIGEKTLQISGKDETMLDPYSYLRPEFVFDYLASAEDKKEAGRFEYSNFGMGLLAHVLEHVTGKDYESLVVEKLLHPMGMTRTAITLDPDMKESLAQGYTAKGLPTPLWTFGALAGAGGYSSPAEDLLKFIQANVEEGGVAHQRFLRMRVPQFGGGTGIGWLQPTFLDRLFGNRSVVWHNGMVGGFASYLSIDLESRTGVMVLANQACGTDMLGMMLMRQARTQSWSSHAPDEGAVSL